MKKSDMAGVTVLARTEWNAMSEAAQDATKDLFDGNVSMRRLGLPSEQRPDPVPDAAYSADIGMGTYLMPIEEGRFRQVHRNWSCFVVHITTRR